ncbi:hypothetical protein BX265_6159 [Streptomyces sp. TLI_235]|nr:hypothetical protein [Streptomyces sp. TLI_235]PBC71549.1 hypothetical protein BX265_6159 [Streptomyces sp. TLI_235]
MPTTAKHQTYLRRHGIRATTTPDRAAHHIAALRTAGLTDAEISTATRIGPTTLYRIAKRHGPITRAVEQRVLATPIPDRRPAVAVGVATIPADGTRRRLQALVVAGFPPVHLGREFGIDRRNLHVLLHGADQRTTLRTAARVMAYYLAVWDQPAERHGVRPTAAARARALGSAHEWAPAAAWDDIDDPQARPDSGVHVSRLVAIVEDTAELARQGYSREGIAGRLGGIGWDAVRQAHRRAGAKLPPLLD